MLVRYDTRRQLTSESSEQVGLSHWSIGYGYDANAALSSQTYPSGTVVNYAPNALGQPTAVRDQTGNSYATGIVYFPNGAVRQFVYGNGVIHSLVLNGRQLPQQVRDANVASLEYQYDANGNVTTILDQQRGADYNRSMHYDGLDRLSEAGSVQFGGDHWNRYTYDVLDNMLTSKLPGVSEHNYWYDANNRLTNVQNNAGATIVGLSYDAQGNLKNKNGQAFLFDYGNRLREVVGKESYRYDAYGHRVFSGGASASNLQIYSQAGQLLYAQTPANSGTDYIYLDASLLATRTAAAITFQHTDALGSPIAATDASGRVIDRTDYQPYGSAIDKTVDGIGYSGQAMDAATGLTYMQQRYYDPHVKRFISVDPVAADSVLAANFNRYWYANNNPYRFTDPDGRKVKFADGAPADFLRNISSAIRYLDNAGVADPIGEVELRKEFVAIAPARDRSDTRLSNFNPSNNVLTWADKGGIEIIDVMGNKATISPALALGHEFEHASNALADIDSFARDVKTFDKGYGNQEERNVIEGYERPAAQKLREGERRNHGGKPISYKCPTPECK